jgi:hypothetical protein
MRINQEARDLADRFPDLQDAENAKKLAGPGGLVEQALQHADPNVAKQLAAEPWFWGLVHMSNKAAEIANNEGSRRPRRSTPGVRQRGGTRDDTGRPREADRQPHQRPARLAGPRRHLAHAAPHERARHEVITHSHLDL